MEVTIHAVKHQDPNREVPFWIALPKSDDLADWAEHDPQAFVFEMDPPNTGSIIDVNDALVGYGLHKDDRGRYSVFSQSYAYALLFCQQHVQRITGPGEIVPGGVLESPTLDELKRLPMEVLEAFLYRTDPTRAPSEEVVQSLKKSPASPPPPKKKGR